MEGRREQKKKVKMYVRIFIMLKTYEKSEENVVSRILNLYCCFFPPHLPTSEVVLGVGCACQLLPNQPGAREGKKTMSHDRWKNIFPQLSSVLSHHQQFAEGPGT
jgi:hypothetical protein